MTAACVIGWPIAHSRSPMIHGYWLKRYGIDGRYDRVPVRPEELDQFLERVREGEYAGCNVTIPHKEAVFGKVRIADPATRRIGAVNTVYRKDGELVGRNTDGLGFILSVKSAIPGWSADGARVAILGAGGAARAIVAALIEEGARSVTLINRTLERAEALARHFGSPVSAAPWDNMQDRLSEADLLVNTTSLGMAHNPPLDISLSSISKRTIVADIVYSPLETPLLKAARARGNPAVDGLGMLLHQAAPGFELWFGVRPEVTPELRALLVADLEAAR